MLKSLNLKNVGSLPDREIRLGNRMNILTGDNGLGKSFLLDIIWYILTRKWSGEINPKITSGYMARPQDPSKLATISFGLQSEPGKSIKNYTVSFNRKEQAWLGNAGRPYSNSLVIYAHSDGSFSVWDPARNYWTSNGNVDVQDRLPAFVFSPNEIWDGLKGKENKLLCNGLISDWAKWQNDSKSWEFAVLETVLAKLSPPDFKLAVGELTRISIDDPRDIPTIKMSYGSVPVILASAGIRRILALSYFLTWALSEHIRACKLLGTKPSAQITFIIDEIEAHLHPKWQRQIMGSIINVLNQIPYILSEKIPLDYQVNDFSWGNNLIQVIASTHSPLIMVALENRFNPEIDKWLDFDVDKTGNVSFEERDFEKFGDVNAWLTGEAFNLESSRSPEAELAIRKITDLLNSGEDLTDSEELKSAYQNLLKTLPPFDDFLFTLRYSCEKKGWKLK